MQAGESRPLTRGEAAIARTMFAASLDPGVLRVVQAPRLFFGAMVPAGRVIWFSRWRAARDFAEADIEEQGWLVHEFAHCWQARRGVFLAGAKLFALGDRAYSYAIAPGKALTAYNIEQQAEIARHLFLARMGAACPHPRDALEAIWARAAAMV